MSEMTIAQGLRMVKRTKGEVADLTRRLQGCSNWRGDERPAFDFAAVETEREAKVEALVTLQARIAVANANARIEFRGRPLTLAEAILRMGELKGKAELVKGLSLRTDKEREHDGYDGHRPLYAERQWQAVMTEPERVAKLAALRDEMDQLNDLIERTNHITPV